MTRLMTKKIAFLARMKKYEECRKECMQDIKQKVQNLRDKIEILYNSLPEQQRPDFRRVSNRIIQEYIEEFECLNAETLSLI